LIFVANTGKEAFEDAYMINIVIGSGGFGTVYAGNRRCDGLSVSIEILLMFFYNTGDS